MADIQVTSELTLDASNFMQVLGQAQQSLDQFAQKGMSISPTLDLTNWQASLAQMQQMAVQQAQQIQQTFGSMTAMVSIGVDLVKADAALQAWLATVQNVSLNLTAPNAVQIGTDIGNAAGAAFQAAVSGMNFPAPSGGGGGGGGNGGRRGPGSGGMMGFGRLLMPLMLLHQATGAYEIGEHYDKALLDSGGDYQKMLEADIHRKEQQDGLVMGGGRVMRAIRETYIDSDDDSVEGQEESLRKMHRNRQDAVEADHTRKRDQGLDFRLSEATSKTQRERQEKSAEHKRLTDIADIDTGIKAKEQKVQDDYNLGMVKATNWESMGHQYTHSNFFDPNAYQTLHAEADTMRNQAEQIRQAELNRLTGAGGERERAAKKIDDAATAEKARAKETADMSDTMAESQSHAAILRASGDDAGAERIENKAKLDEEQLKARDTSERAGNAFNESRPFLEQEQDREVRKSQLQKSQGIEDIHADARTQMRQALGQEDIRSKDSEYLRKMQDRIDVLSLGNGAEREKAEALRQELPTMLKARTLQEERNERLENAASGRRIADIEASAGEATQRASGDVRGAAESAMRRQLNDRVAGSRRQSEKMTDPAEKARLWNEALTEEASIEERIGALRITNSRQDEQEITDIKLKAYEDRLQAAGRFNEAELAAMDHGYDKQIKAARDAHRDKVAEAIEDEKRAAHEKRDAGEQHKVDDLNEDAIEKRLRREGRGGLADLRSLDKKYEKEMRDATGKPEEQLAILKNKQEDLEALKQGEKYTPSSLEDAWKHIGHGGPGGGLGPGTIDREKVENAAAMRKIQEDLKKAPAHPADDPDLINGGSSGPLIRNPDVNTPDPSHSWLTKFFGDAIQGATGGKNPFEGLSGSAEKLNAAADKIVSGPTLVCADFT